MERLNLTPNFEESLGYVFDAVFWTRQQVGNEVPVIGFSGAPWTLMGYMIQGGAARNFDTAKQWLYLFPQASRQLLRALRDIVVDYLIGQYDAGAPLLTVFETNCGELPPAVFEEFCVPDLKHIASEVKRRRPHALISIFPKDGEIATFEDSAYDVVGVSWTTSAAAARRACPSKTLQGNLDPHALYADPAAIHAEVQRMVGEFGVDKYIANLGHGMLPDHPVEGARAFVDSVDTCTRDAVLAHRHGREDPAQPAATVSIAARADAPRGPLLTLHLQEDTTVSIPFSLRGASELKSALAEFVNVFKRKAAGEKPEHRSDFEYTWDQGGVKLELFANPNAFATIFDAKLFLKVRCDDDAEVVSELPLSSLQADLDALLE